MPGRCEERLFTAHAVNRHGAPRVACRVGRPEEEEGVAHDVLVHANLRGGERGGGRRGMWGDVVCSRRGEENRGGSWRCARLCISDHLGPPRRISANLGASRTISDHLGPSRTISDHLGPSRLVGARVVQIVFVAPPRRRVPVHQGAEAAHRGAEAASPVHKIVRDPAGRRGAEGETDLR